MSLGEGNLHEEVDRLKGVNGELCEEINRQERRIRELEALVCDLAPFVCADDGIDEIERRMAELGIEVQDG